MSTYTPIATQTLSSAAASVTFSSIPQGYTDLVLISSTKTSSGSADGAITCTVNGDTGSNYSHTAMYGNGSSALSFRASSLTKLYFGRWSNNQYTTTKTQFNNYSNSTTNKTILSQGGNSDNYIFEWVNLWRSTSPITSMELRVDDATNFASGSTFTLYGIAGGGVTAKAAGGVVTTDGTYAYHTFLSSGAFTPSQALTVDYLVVAGGGSGGLGDGAGNYGAGGGAGGMRCTVTASGGSPGTVESALSLSANYAYPVIVGAGGAAQTVTKFYGSSGNNSVFGTITAIGGGGGGGALAFPPFSGGSGGGGSIGGAGAAGTANQGFAGGAYPTSGYAAGGGGAGAVGDSAAAQNNAGGAGVATSITGSSVTYAAGGNGGVVSPSSGAANTGNGGGGKTLTGTSGAGGSGIVVIRYAL